jgi:hypothetical protein
MHGQQGVCPLHKSNGIFLQTILPPHEPKRMSLVPRLQRARPHPGLPLEKENGRPMVCYDV